MGGPAPTGIWTVQGELVELFVECMSKFYVYNCPNYTLVAWCLLLTIDGPTAYVGISPTNRHQSLTITLEELEPSPVYYCSADGYPQPSLSWSFNGGDLPNGIFQMPVSLVSI